jgi:hypothetical protein
MTSIERAALVGRIMLTVHSAGHSGIARDVLLKQIRQVVLDHQASLRAQGSTERLGDLDIWAVMNTLRELVSARQLQEHRGVFRLHGGRATSTKRTTWVTALGLHLGVPLKGGAR